MSDLHEPYSYIQASKSPNWVSVMKDELDALERNQTWELTSLPKGKKAISSKWVYKLKLKSDGTVDRYKARLVTKGFNQVQGLDYHEIFSPVAKCVTVRLMFSVVAARGWPLHQVDINNTFLQCFLDEKVYMTPPEGYHNAKEGQACCLKRSLYGLKQASRQWNAEITKHLISFGFTQSHADNCLFTYNSSKGTLILIVYVDDLLISGTSESLVQELKHSLHAAFTIKDLGFAKYFLGLEVARSSAGIFVNQRKYISDLIADTGLLDAKVTNVPLPKGLHLQGNEGELNDNPSQYRRLVGRLLYLGFTRPDIMHSVHLLSQFVQSPRKPHWMAALHVVRYLKSTTSLFFSASSSFCLEAFCDAD